MISPPGVPSLQRNSIRYRLRSMTPAQDVVSVDIIGRNNLRIIYQRLRPLRRTGQTLDRRSGDLAERKRARQSTSPAFYINDGYEPVSSNRRCLPVKGSA